jgi:tetratricopeptide (TPR) repeat protein
MNDHPDDARPTDTDVSPPESRCDNYTSYLDETYGYAYAARDIVSIQDLERHDALLEGSEPGLDERDPDELDDFLRLGMARGWRRQGRLERFLQVVDVVLNSDDDHPAVDYGEVYLLAARALVDDTRYERALSMLERAIERSEYDDREYRQLKGVTLHQMGEHERAAECLDALADDHPDDVETYYEVAEDFARIGVEDVARRWISRAREVAERLGDRAVEVDLKLLESRLERGEE